jgi:Flp pilus assembly pilin Flp
MDIIKHSAVYLVRYLRGTRAVAAMEYAIIVGVVVVGVGAAVVAFQEEVKDFIEKAATDITDTRTTMEGEGEGDE